MRTTSTLQGKWTGRFVWASIIQGFFAVLWSAFLVAPWVNPAPSRVIAAGDAGTWLFVGYVLYITIGVVAVAVTAVFYIYIERILGRAYQGVANYLAWAHFLLMNVGVAGATWLMMIGGYLGGSAMLPTNQGGLGYNTEQVHVNILAPYPTYIFPFVVLAIIGVMLGGLGYLLNARRNG